MKKFYHKGLFQWGQAVLVIIIHRCLLFASVLHACFLFKAVLNFNHFLKMAVFIILLGQPLPVKTIIPKNLYKAHFVD